ncbi:sulfotransferase family protein [Halanaerobacter jeridensis]|uniref:Sulfotransferase family protein n=1 Tax=Halanaerobacter jeridensis TaxID=706427 RepID=A0A939BSA4_9FIRM|nr:sulfotransferase [Halanaerobacter jeridensis]MBM7556926.1 hypothetical protein [Halanaerobacter jeridensis]
MNILVTGVPRSGTTFLGRSIALSSEVNYLWEPFNKNYRRRIPDVYPYIGNKSSKEKKEKYRQIVSETLEFKKLKPNIRFLPDNNIIEVFLKKLGVNRTFFRYNWAKVKNIFLNKEVTLFKDPFGIFLSEFLMKEFDFKVIVAIRHPAAVINSRKKLDFHFSFDFWRQQNDLYDEQFREIETKMKKYGRNNNVQVDSSLTENKNIVIDSAFHWLTCYNYIVQLKNKHPDNLLLVKHEDLCLDPIKEFESIYNHVNLEYNNKISSEIKEVTSGDKTEQNSKDLAKLEKRNAKELIFKWKEKTSKRELNHIEKITGEISKCYYKRSDFWEI